MENKDKRSLLLSMVLGDGCLHLTSTGYGAFTADHGIQQSDYITWKAQIVGKIIGREIVLRQGHKGKSIQFSVCFKRARAWRKFCYPGGKKDLTKILPFIRHPEFAVAVWLMDDGYVEPSISKLATGEKKNYGARFRIFTNSQAVEKHDYLIKWFQDNLQVEPKMKLVFEKKLNKHAPFLKFSQEDSLKIWEKIRSVVLKFKSMQYKFRYIEQIYQSRILQRTLAPVQGLAG